MSNQYEDSWWAAILFTLLVFGLGVMVTVIRYEMFDDHTVEKYLDKVEQECKQQEGISECTLTENGWVPDDEEQQ